ncbi:dynein light chain Tctex-type protein 2B-like isoform X2 [Anopheles ziemanni]|uniref:dynein light chain Tctex-type protein 2B-like isoform X2 n=1 Tax=Anopheles coustani TaxID=139045 RepID=UPI0026589ABF|nr:dynein light chain Tctex-type protein 2B-like isoform X2 [Anopheles coustani]XP_058172174.1 dynein light chain Tctex-type protein 2B-like isoform X2 [Anopheles ziemanni]
MVKEENKLDFVKSQLKMQSDARETSIPPAPAAYQMRPALSETFKSERIREIIQTVLTETLTGQTYTAADASRWTKSLADEISLKVKDLEMYRYKHVVQVMLGQQLGAGCKYVSRCRWDTECDNYATAEFKNSTIFCVVTVYGLYLY